MQAQIVSQYKSAYALFKQDKHFSVAELDYMANVYSGILDQSLKNLDQALLVVNALTTSMTDAQRLNIINNASGGMQKNYDDLRRFNNQNVQLSLQRGSAEGNIDEVKELYGLEWVTLATASSPANIHWPDGRQDEFNGSLNITFYVQVLFLFMHKFCSLR